MLIKKNLFQELKTKEPEDKGTLSHFAEKIEHSHITSKDNILEEAYKEAESILNTAKYDAQEILASAENQIREAVESEVAQRMGRLDELEDRAVKELDSFLNAKREIIQDSKDLILDLALNLASKILNKKVREDQNILLNMLSETAEEMLKDVQENAKLTLVVNPADSNVTNEFARRITEKSGNRIEITVREDSGVSEGSCMVEGPSGTLDLNFASQLALFKERMLQSNF